MRRTSTSFSKIFRITHSRVTPLPRVEGFYNPRARIGPQILQQSHNAMVTSNFRATISVAICNHERFTLQNLNPSPTYLLASSHPPSATYDSAKQSSNRITNCWSSRIRHLNHKSITHFRNLPGVARPGVTKPQSWWELLHTKMSKSSSYSNARPKGCHMKKSRSCASRNGLERRNGK